MNPVKFKVSAVKSLDWAINKGFSSDLLTDFFVMQTITENSK